MQLTITQKTSLWVLQNIMNSPTCVTILIYLPAPNQSSNTPSSLVENPLYLA